VSLLPPFHFQVTWLTS
jgi:amino acid transporter, AAT family